MALQKSIEQENGYTASYHRICSVSYLPKKVCNFIVESYKDAQARLDGKKPMKSTACSVYQIDNEEPLLEQLYDHVKELPAFEGSEDA